MRQESAVIKELLGRGVPILNSAGLNLAKRLSAHLGTIAAKRQEQDAQYNTHVLKISSLMPARRPDDRN